MTERHELFEELEAFDPLWFKVYHNIAEAVEICIAETPYVQEIYDDWLTTSEGKTYIEHVAGVFDYAGAIRDEREAEENSSLPFKMSNFGSAPGGQR